MKAGLYDARLDWLHGKRNVGKLVMMMELGSSGGGGDGAGRGNAQYTMVGFPSKNNAKFKKA